MERPQHLKRILLSGVCIAATSLGSTLFAQAQVQVDWTTMDPGLVGGVRALDISPDGRYVAYGSEFASEIKIRRMSDGALVTNLQVGTNMGVTGVEFSPVTSEIVSSWNLLGWSGAVFGGSERFRAGHTAPAMTSTAHDAFVTCIAWSPTGASILTAAADGEASLANPATGAILRTVDHGSGVSSIAWTPDGTHFATGGVNGDVKIWDASTGALKRTIVAHLSIVSEMEFHSDNQHLATGGGDPGVDTAIHVHDSYSGSLITSHTIQYEEVTGLAFVANGSLLMSSDYSGTLRISQSFGPLEISTIDLGRGPRVTSLDVDAATGRYAYGTGSGWITVARR
ncbi:MAG: WD40 repeat domain-containing protein [Planctomycetota bacterium]